MPPKATKQEEPAAKKAKTDEPEKEEPKKEEVKEEEKKFEEPDAQKDSRQPVKESATFTSDQTTLNVVPTMGGKLLTTITEGGMSYLLAGARANIGVKSGRYMFEVKIIQMLSSSGDKKTQPVLKLGFSTAGSSLFLGEDAMGIGFSSQGEFIADKKTTNFSAKARFTKDKVVAVVLNLDPKSPNANTIALYVDGEKIAEPKPLPEGLKGEPLFPHLTYKNMTIRSNFGPTPLKDLPFKCRMINGAANSDVMVQAPKEPKGKKYEVMVPVAFPDEGTFAWVDSFLEDNPHYVELSDRKIAEWCKSSGLIGKHSGDSSNDKPHINYGCHGLDNFSVRSVINSLAPCIPRHYLIMEVKNNLLASGRKEILKKFNYPCFKKVARVIMGKPNDKFKGMVQNKILKAKQDKADAAFKAKKEADAKKKMIEKRKQELEQKKKADSEKKDEETKDEPMEKPEEEEEEPPVVELTEEEKAMNFPKSAHADLTPAVLRSSYAKFTTPQDDEGFDDISYEWEDAAKSAAYLQNWVLNKKLTTRIDDIKPGQFFKDKAVEFEKAYKEWQTKQKATKKPAKKATEEEEGKEVDIFSVVDINDVEGVPLYDKFVFEDWELVKLRFEYCMLVLSFKKDCDDPDRVGIPVDHVSFYYSKYFKKPINLKSYGVSAESELFALLKDVVSTKDGLLISQLSDDLENCDIFVKLTEEHRRERQRRIDAGDETARLKFTPPPKPVEKPVEKPEAKAKAEPKAEAKAPTNPAFKPAPKKADVATGAGKGKGKGK